MKNTEEGDAEMEKKKLLIYAHYYIPDTASTGQILRELAEGMLDKFDITVICVGPSYLGTIEDKYRMGLFFLLYFIKIFGCFAAISNQSIILLIAEL